MNNGAALGLGCIIIIVAILIGLCIAALILMAAVWIANKCLSQPASRHYIDDYDDYEDDWEYERPRRRRRGGGAAIPPPNFGWAVLIVFVTAIVQFGVAFAMGFVAGMGGAAGNQQAMLGLQCCSYIVGFFIMAGMCSAMLPTTFARACLVALFDYLISLALAIIIAVPIILLVGLKNFR